MGDDRLGRLVGGYSAVRLRRLSTWGPAIEGLYIVPAIIGAVVLGGMLDAVVRFGTEGTYDAEMRPI